MKCKFWDEDCIHLEPCEVAPAKFWTPAERAGLKAMGTVFHVAQSHAAFEDVITAVWMIKEYIKASRKVKESK